MPSFAEDDALEGMTVQEMATMEANLAASLLLVRAGQLHPVQEVLEPHVAMLALQGIRINVRALTVRVLDNRRRIWMALNLQASRCLHHPLCKAQLELADPARAVVGAEHPTLKSLCIPQSSSRHGMQCGRSQQ